MKDFQRLRNIGKKFISFPIVFIFSEEIPDLLVVSIRKKIGNACVRNKIRRRIKHIFYDINKEMSENMAKKHINYSVWCLIQPNCNYDFNTLKKSIEKFKHFLYAQKI